MLSTDDNWTDKSSRYFVYWLRLRTRGIDESVDSIEPPRAFFYTSTCNSRLSDLIVPIAGLSILWFITATKLHSNIDTMGWEQYGRKRIIIKIKFFKIIQFFFSLDYLIQHWNEYINEQCRNLLIERKKVWLTWKFFSKLLFIILIDFYIYIHTYTLETRVIIKTRVVINLSKKSLKKKWAPNWRPILPALVWACL